MRQQSFATDDFEKYRKKTRKEIFLDEMDQIIPWKALSKVIKPYYPKLVLPRFSGHSVKSSLISFS